MHRLHVCANVEGLCSHLSDHKLHSMSYIEQMFEKKLLFISSIEPKVFSQRSNTEGIRSSDPFHGFQSESNELMNTLMGTGLRHKTKVQIWLYRGPPTWGHRHSKMATKNEKKFVTARGVQRAILNFTPGPQGRISPLGVNSAPRGEVHPFVHPQG
jgi:hypothetical protein